MRHETAIIGGGIAALSALHYLRRGGHGAVLFEQGRRVGGHINTLSENGLIFETGPNTFLSSSAPLMDLTRELKLEGELLSPSAVVGKRRFIYSKGRLHIVPAGPQLMLSPLLSLKGRLRIMAEPFIARRSDSNDETVASFIGRRLGKEVVSTLVDPFISGIYAGDPGELSINSLWPRMAALERDHGGIFRGMRHIKSELKGGTLCSFKTGLSALTGRLYDTCKDDIRTGVAVDRIEKNEGGYRLMLRNTANNERSEISARRVIIATPAHTTGELLSDIAAPARNILEQIPYVPLAVVHTVFGADATREPLNGFGFLIPRSEGIRMLGSIWSSSLFEGRAGKGETLLTNFIGGATDRDIDNLSDDEVERIVLADLHRTLQISARPALTKVTRHKKAISQFTLGHGSRIEAFKNATKDLTGLYFTGSYFTGISISDTIDHAKRTANSVIEHAG